MTHAQELTLAIASLLQMSPLSPDWDEAHKRVGELKKAYVAALLQETQTTTELMSQEEYMAWLSHTDVEPEAEPQPKPAPTDEEQKQAVADIISKSQASKDKQARVKAQKPLVAKAGGVKSKEKLIIDMNAAELKALAKKNNTDYSTVNFRKADEKDAFRSKLAKELGRSSELNYSVK
jgi:hypothetical protein